MIDKERLKFAEYMFTAGVLFVEKEFPNSDEAKADHIVRVINQWDMWQNGLIVDIPRPPVIDVLRIGEDGNRTVTIEPLLDNEETDNG